MELEFDVILVGGGLSSCLFAWGLLEGRPDLQLVILEKNEALGGDHTWSFHGTDLSPLLLAKLKPVIKKSWDGYQVKFPKYHRQFQSTYHTIRSEDFHAFFRNELRQQVRFSSDVELIAKDRVRLKSGEEMRAKLVVDARGFGPTPQDTGFQKFVGIDFEFAESHGLKQPLIMDVTVPQTDGFRFIYVLPFSDTTALIEDTYYSNTSHIDETECAKEIYAYAQAQGWIPVRELRREAAALPIPCRIENTSDDQLKCGVAAGAFHATTGYSFPWAARLYELGRKIKSEDLSYVEEELRKLNSNAIQQNRYFEILNQMLFHVALPEERYVVLERFYRLPERIIEKFYAAKLSALDRVRILIGKPPVSILKALKYFFSGKEVHYGTNP